MPQIDPMIPFNTPKGKGFAFWRTDYSQEHDTLYSIIITATGEVWDIPQPQVRGVKNISMGRTEPATPFETCRTHRFANPKGYTYLQWVLPTNSPIFVPSDQDPNDPATLVEGGPWRLEGTRR